MSERTYPPHAYWGHDPSGLCACRDCSADEELDDDEDQDCGCRVHPRWCAWNGPCCDHCTHEAEEAHAECCPPPPGRPVERTRRHEEDERE